MGDGGPGDRLWRRAARWWPVVVALLVTIALAICGQHWFASSGRSNPLSEPAALAQQFAYGATDRNPAPQRVVPAQEPR